MTIIADLPPSAAPPFTDADLARVWNYWFADRTLSASLQPGVDPYADHYKLNHVLWFHAGPDVGAELVQHFEPLAERAAHGALDAWRATPRGCLALVLLLDAFPSVMYRDTARAFAHTARAVAVAEHALAQRFDRDLAPGEALFLFLALVHSERVALVRRGADGVAELVTRCARSQTRVAKSWHVDALKHLDLLERFGRDPRRNTALDRATTPDEASFLERPAFAALFARLRTPRVAAASTPPASEPRAVSAAPGRPRLRILALHGLRQNADVFRTRTRKMARALEDIAEFTYVTAPHRCAPSSDVRPGAQTAFGEYPDNALQRAWWIPNDDNTVYDGFDASVAFVENVVRTQGPFDAVVGFSQGGTLAAILAAMQPHPVFAFKFVVCVSAFPSRARAHAAYVRPGSVKLPAMHVLGLTDTMVTPDRSLKLFEVFEPETAALAKHSAGHFAPNAWPYREMRAFVERFVATEAPADVVPAPAPPPSDVLYTQVCEALAAHAAESPIDVRRVQRLLREMADEQQWQELQSVALRAHALRDGASDAMVAALEAVRQSIVERFAQQLRGDLDAAAALQPSGDASPTATRARRLFGLLATPVTPEDSPVPEAEPWPSSCARFAPRGHGRVDKACRLAKDIARAMFPHADMLAFIASVTASGATPAATVTRRTPDDPATRRRVRQHLDADAQAKNLSYQRYGQALSLLGATLTEMDPSYATERVRKLRQARALTPDALAELKAQPISQHVTEPEPEPVVPCTLAELNPLLEHLRGNAPVPEQTAFDKGTLTTDGRLDLCKQVVGPEGIRPLLGAMMRSDRVKRLLLGNNIVGDDGAAAIAQFIRERHDSPLECWYIAGNHIGLAGIRHVCDALAHDTRVTSLWLKRNPLKSAGMAPLAELLRTNTTIEVLDVVNCGLLDDGLATLLRALMGPGANKTLRHLYVGTNGVTARSAPLVAEYLANDCALESLYLSCNRLGDDGAARIAGGLAANRSLRRVSLASNRIGPEGAAALGAALATHPTIELLDLGFTKATVAVGELGNFLGDEGARAMAAMLTRNTTLRMLDLLHNDISQVGVNAIREALKINRTLTAIQLTQFGRVHNEPGKEEIRAALARNRERVPPDEAARLAKLELPDHVTDIYSVYRTHV